MDIKHNESKIDSSLLLEVHDYLDEIIIALDEQGRIVNINTAARRFFQAEQSQWLNQPYLIFAHYFNSPLLNNDPFIDVSHNGIIWNSLSRNGMIILIGKIVNSSACILPDLIPVPEDYLQSILVSNYEGVNIYWKDRKGRLLLCNKQQALSFGLQEPSEIMGLTNTEIAKKLNWDTATNDEIEKNDRYVINKNIAGLFEESAIINGKTRTFQSHKTPFINKKGEIIGLVGISIDITLKKEAEEKLKKSKRATDYYLECILMSCPSNIYWVDKDSRIIGCNDQQAKSFGAISRFDMIGKNIFDIAKMGGATEEMAEKIRENDLYVMASKKNIQMEEDCYINGARKTLLSYKSPMYDENGEVIGLLGISTDITEQKNAEKQLLIAKQLAEEHSRAKTSFIANISHDIRTPLVGIHGIAELLAYNLPEQYQSEIKDIADASHELLDLLNEVIGLSKLELGNQESEDEEFDLLNLVKRLKVLFASAVKKKNLQFKIEYDHNLPNYYFGKRLNVHRILLNLLGNAIKFTDEGTITIRIMGDENLLLDDHQVPIKIEIEDTGIGISLDKQEMIFESFYRVHPAYSGRYKGNGLGLAIVKQFIRQMGGEVTVKSEIDVGSVFTITFMLEKIERGNEIKVASTALLPASNDPSTLNALEKMLVEDSDLRDLLSSNIPSDECIPRVLLVEDHPMIQAYTIVLLNEQNCYVDSALSGAEALQKLKTNHYDLILMDIGLPDFDGFVLVSKIRHEKGQYSLNANTPMLALTAHVDAANKQQALLVGMREVITKPITREKIQEIFREYIVQGNNPINSNSMHELRSHRKSI